MQTLVINGYEELQEVYDSVSEDFNEIDYTPWMHDELDRMARQHNDYFVNATAPDGQSWPPLALSTIKRKGHAIRLVHTGNLFRSLTQKGLKQSSGEAIREAIQSPTGAYMSFGTSLEYSPYHDKASDNRPARRHVGINSRYLDGMVNRVADFAVERLTE